MVDPRVRFPPPTHRHNPRESGLRAIRYRDVLLGVDSGIPVVKIFIRRSQTDLNKRGTPRTLYGANSVMCPAQAAATFIATKRGRYAGDDFIFESHIAQRLGKILKLIALASELPIGRIPCHSLRSGGRRVCSYPVYP